MSMVGRSFMLLALLLVASCGGHLPNTAWTRHEARIHYRVNDETPLVALMRERHIVPPDEAAATPLLDQLQAELAKSDRSGRYDGVTYELTRGNTLGSNWIVQTPNSWGKRASELKSFPLDCKNCEPDVLLPSCSSDADCGGGTCGTIWPAAGGTARRQVCFGHSDALVNRIYDLIAGAKSTVDITLLQPPPDTRLLGTLRAAFGALARSGRQVSIRILIGQYPPDTVDTKDFLDKVSADMKDVAGAHVRLIVAAMRSCTSFDDCDSYSWNHAKIIAVDGREALVGGHNLYSRDYLVDDPVHDLSMRISGPAAASASGYVDTLWQYVCSNLAAGKAISLSGLPDNSCPGPSAKARPAPSKGGLPVMAVGRLAAGITQDFANQSDLARDLMLGAAKHDIKIAQQDLGFNFGRADTLFPESNLERLVTFLMRGEGDVYIVLSNEGSYAPDGGNYSNGVPLTALAHRLREMVVGRLEAKDPQSRYAIRLGPDPANAILCDHVHLAPLRFGPDATWPDHGTFASHMKFWLIDDRAFYIGSDNMYPVNLQEYGYIVDDSKAAGELLDALWKPLWQWSERAAVSGPEVKNCIFREIIK
jgi:phosphatidylserine/phosphatidylglycerophosphate/cardiolipin synthase-like enzyme